MGVLDTLKTDTEDSADTSETTSTDSGLTIGLGGKGAKATATSEGALANMQKMLEEKIAQRNGFMESLKDAAAWWTPGLQGPSAALAQRDQARAEQDKNIFGLQSQIAANRRSLDMAKQVLGTPGQPQVGADGQPVQGVSAPTGGLLGQIRDPQLRAALAQEFQNDQAKGLTAIRAAIAEQNKATDDQKNLKWMVDNGYITKDEAAAYAKVKYAGAPAFNPHDVRTPRGDKQVTPLAAAGLPTSPAAPVANAPAAPVANAPAAPVANAPAAPVANAPAAPVANAPAAPVANAPAAKPVTPPVKPVAPAAKKVTIDEAFPKSDATKPTLGVSPFDPGTKQDLQWKADQAKIDQEVEKETKIAAGKETGRDEGTRLNKLINSGSKSIETKNELDQIMTIANDPNLNKAIGITYQGNKGALIKALETYGPLKGSSDDPTKLEEVYARTLTPEQQTARQVFKSAAGRLAQEYRTSMLKGMGQVSNYEDKMANDAFGLADKNDPRANLLLARMMMEKVKTDDKLLERWRTYESAEQKAGRRASYSAFEGTEAYKSAVAEKDTALRQLNKDFFGEGIKGSKKPAAKSEEEDRWAKKYGTKKP